jgi:hypothetical protein
VRKLRIRFDCFETFWEGKINPISAFVLSKVQLSSKFRTAKRTRILQFEHVESIEILALERVCLRWPCKKSADLHPRQGTYVIYCKGTFLQGSTKPHFTTQNRLETIWKNRPFFNMLLLLQRFLWSNFFLSGRPSSRKDGIPQTVGGSTVSFSRQVSNYQLKKGSVL